MFTLLSERTLTKYDYNLSPGDQWSADQSSTVINRPVINRPVINRPGIKHSGIKRPRTERSTKGAIYYISARYLLYFIIGLHPLIDSRLAHQPTQLWHSGLALEIMEIIIIIIIFIIVIII